MEKLFSELPEKMINKEYLLLHDEPKSKLTVSEAAKCLQMAASQETIFVFEMAECLRLSTEFKKSIKRLNNIIKSVGKIDNQENRFAKYKQIVK